MAELNYRDVKAITEFKSKMIDIFKEPKNINKLHWEHVPNNFLFVQLHEELLELEKELFDYQVTNGRSNNYDAIMRECLDVANYAFMIYDNAKRIKDK